MKSLYRKCLNAFMEYFDIGPTVALTIFLVSGFIILTALGFFIQSAPPKTMTLAAGPEGSTFHNHALKYQKALAANGISLKIISTKGSIENLSLINDDKNKIDLAFVQSGSEDSNTKISELVSLGAINQQPLFFFYRGEKEIYLKNFKGKRIAVGLEGSGARRLALKMLKLNGITEGESLLSMNGKDASVALVSKKIDGAFLMGEEASLSVLRTLLHDPDINLFSFNNANAYIRKIPILHILDLPEGVLDFEKNIPDQNITLMGPMVEIIARDNLHPALSDMILDAANTIHGNAGIFKKQGDFPVSVKSKIELSDDAHRFYKSGKTFLYRYLPFWLASLVSRLLLVFLPMLIVLIPAVRSIPAIFRWFGQLRIRRRYRSLLRLEEKFRSEKNPEVLKTLSEQFKIIEIDIEQMRVRSTLAMQFYTLRKHMEYVRRLIDSRIA